MRNPQHQYRPVLIVNPAHNAVSPDSVPPESHLVSRQGFAKTSWVLVSGDALLEKSHDPSLGGPIQLPEFA
jgi:hypothetical protein